MSARESAREKFLADRRKGLGGSDIAPVLGLSKYRTALHVYLEKIGEAPTDEEDTARMELGRVMEQPILDKYAELVGARIVDRGVFLRHPDLAFLLANLDAIAENEHGDHWVVDAKSVHFRLVEAWGADGTDSVPEDVFWQMHHYCFLTGYAKADVAAAMAGEWPPRIFSVPGDRELYEMILPDLERFWWHVEKRTPPPPDFAHETTAALMRRLYPDVDVKKEITLPADYFEKVVRYRALGKIAALAEKKRELLKAELLFAIGDAGKARIEGTDIALNRTPVSGGKVVNYVTKGYVRLDPKFPKTFTVPAIEATAVALIEGETNG